MAQYGLFPNILPYTFFHLTMCSTRQALGATMLLIKMATPLLHPPINFGGAKFIDIFLSII